MMRQVSYDEEKKTKEVIKRPKLAKISSFESNRIYGKFANYKYIFGAIYSHIENFLTLFY